MARPPQRLWVKVVGLVVLTAVITGLVIWSLMRSSLDVSRSATQFVINPPPTAPLSSNIGSEVAISPDGRQIVYLARRDSTTQLYIRSLDGLTATPIPGTEDAGTGPFFSPDGEWVAFRTRGTLKKVSVLGGPAMTISETSGEASYGSWGLGDTIVFATGPGGLHRVSAAGGRPEMLAMPDGDKGEISYRRPQILPDGKTVLFTIWLGSNRFQTAVFSLETGERKIVVEEGRSPRYSSTGHLVYGLSMEGTLVAVPFDVARLETTGSPVPLLEGIRQSLTGDLDYALSDGGTLVYVPSGENRDRSLVWVDRLGSERLVRQEKRYYATPRISPDGQRMSVTALDRQGGTQVWIYEIPRGILTPLTFDRGRNVRAIWTPDGKRLTYHSHTMAQDIFWKATDGTAEEELLTTNPNGKLPTSWSPNGKILAFSRRSGIGEVGSDWDIWLLSPEDEEEPQPFVATEFDEWGAVFSPDGEWIAFTSDRSGQDEVYVKPYPGEGAVIQISLDGGSEPVWAPDGKELFYRNGDQMMIVSVQTNPALMAETPRLLFEGSYVFGGGAAAYDISTNGEDFIMVKEETSLTPINVVLNWSEQLKRLVPTN